MPLYGFKKQFAGAVKGGTKKQTIRAKRKRQTVAGETLYLYTGLRTKQCRKLKEVKCKRVGHFTIELNGGLIEIFIDHKRLSLIEKHNMAINDGFDSLTAFCTFFINTHTLPFEGDIIYW